MRAYKHHIAKTFLERPEFISNNGAGIGATIFFDLEYMKQALAHTKKDWWYCELEVTENDFIHDANKHTATLLVPIDAIGNFKPLILNAIQKP